MRNFKAHLPRCSLITGAFVLFIGASSARAFNYAFLYAPVEQINNSTCQSYVLGMALAVQEPVNDPTWRWRVETEDQLRDLELGIRKEVNRARAQRIKREEEAEKEKIERLNTRADWKQAINIYTDGEFRTARETFSSPEELWEWLAKRVPLSAVGQPWFPFTVSTPMTLYIMSFSKIDGHPYDSGHIVSVLGVDTSVKSGASPALLLINSAARASDYECLAPRKRYEDPYAGHAGWTNDYEIKLHGGRYGVDWIERTQ